jgi:hypothetical protein
MSLSLSPGARKVALAVVAVIAGAVAYAMNYGGGRPRHSAVEPAVPRLAAEPTTRRSPKAAAPLPAEYAVLVTRSPFGRAKPPPATGPATAPAPPQPPADPPRRPEAGMTLRGVALNAGRPVAFVEDAASGKTLRLKTGEAVAGGRITSIGFDTVDFDAGGKVTRVGVGENLEGVAVPRPPAPVRAAEQAPATQSAVAAGQVERPDVDKGDRAPTTRPKKKRDASK